ncbi:hypothetical protein G0Q06_02265 [Puniceicoccales bacterium CK1056]|uniref:PEP-CTERM protein-sorting domain-containing protein n=1 Tax=Oceanipulchritudo coccoides TaxID=2706888 RepID=A0A6B2M0J6_9BACT|nr:hypothetical protein [Oceanipulchritudo coccoides]NDV61270.1 hypothetical protein [Oceanipulchritudo coccoides]
MKKQLHLKKLQLIPIALPLCLLCTRNIEASVLMFETFETEGLGTRFLATNSFSDGADDYFIRTDGNAGATGIPEYTHYGDTWYWAAEDIDSTDNPSGEAILDFANIDLTGFDSFTISIDIGAGSIVTFDSVDDFVFVQYRIDAGSWQTALAFQNDGQTFNSNMRQDLNFDGIGEGTMLGFAMQTFTSAAFPITGSLLDVRIDTVVNGGGEAVAFDNIQVVGVPEPAAMALVFGLVAGLFTFKRFLPQREIESRA